MSRRGPIGNVPVKNRVRNGRPDGCRCPERCGTPTTLAAAVTDLGDAEPADDRPDDHHVRLLLLHDAGWRARQAGFQPGQLDRVLHRSLLPPLHLADGAGLRHYHGALRPHGLSRGLQHRHDPLPPQMDAAPAADCSLLDQLHHPHPVLDPYPGGTGRHQRQPAVAGDHQRSAADALQRGLGDPGHDPFPAALYDPQHLCQPGGDRPKPALRRKDTRLHHLPILS